MHNGGRSPSFRNTSEQTAIDRYHVDSTTKVNRWSWTHWSERMITVSSETGIYYIGQHCNTYLLSSCQSNHRWWRTSLAITNPNSRPFIPYLQELIDLIYHSLITLLKHWMERDWSLGMKVGKGDKNWRDDCGVFLGWFSSNISKLLQFPRFQWDG